MADPVWLLVMFDVPTRTKAQTSAANELRNTLKDRGFSRVQLSVYAKFLSNATAALPIQKAVSYTHLRAHETSVEISYAVFCLKKKKPKLPQA